MAKWLPFVIVVSLPFLYYFVGEWVQEERMLRKQELEARISTSEISTKRSSPLSVVSNKADNESEGVGLEEPKTPATLALTSKVRKIHLTDLNHETDIRTAIQFDQWALAGGHGIVGVHIRPDGERTEFEQALIDEYMQSLANQYLWVLLNQEGKVSDQEFLDRMDKLSDECAEHVESLHDLGLSVEGCVLAAQGRY